MFDYFYSGGACCQVLSEKFFADPRACCHLTWGYMLSVGQEGLMRLSSRRAVLGDLSLLREWYADPTTVKNMFLPPSDETEFALYMLRPYRYMVVAGDVPVGTFTLEPHGMSAIVGVLLCPESRGQGRSREVFKLIESAARLHGFRVLSADIYADNAPGVSSFLGNGYRMFLWFEKNLDADETP
jgi:GNAT superfamily N-acetyltransferase